MMSANSLRNQILWFKNLICDLNHTNLFNQFLSNSLHEKHHICYKNSHIGLTFFENLQDLGKKMKPDTICSNPLYIYW